MILQTKHEGFPPSHGGGGRGDGSYFGVVKKGACVIPSARRPDTVHPYLVALKHVENEVTPEISSLIFRADTAARFLFIFGATHIIYLHFITISAGPWWSP